MKESYDPVDSHKNQSQQGVVYQGKPKEKIKEISDYKSVPGTLYLTIGPYHYENFDRYL